VAAAGRLVAPKPGNATAEPVKTGTPASGQVTKMPLWAMGPREVGPAPTVQRCRSGEGCCDDCRAQAAPEAEVSSADDPDEREARQLAKSALDGTPAAPLAPTVKASQISRSPAVAATGSATTAPSRPMDGLGRGDALPAPTRELLRPRLGVDLGDVRIHTGAHANRNARELGAQAFTIGNDVVFADGRYDTRSRAGLELLTHELVHVGQQEPGPVARHVQRDDRDLPAARPGFPIPIVGNAPTVSVNLTALTLTFPDATNRFVAGPKDVQAMFIAVEALVAGQVSDDFVIRAVQVAFDRFKTTGTGNLAGTAQGGETLPVEYTFRTPLAYLKWLKSLGKSLTVGDERLKILELGEAGQWLVDKLASDSAFATDVLGGETIPLWFTGWMQLNEMHQHGRELRAFAAAKDASDADPSDTSLAAILADRASDLYVEILMPVKIMEAIRRDKQLPGEAGYKLIWPPKAGDIKTPVVAPEDQAPSETFGVGFLGFLWTQQNLWPEMRLASGIAARKKVLTTYLGWASQAIPAAAADTALVDQPATANLRAYPATLTAFPAIGPPLFDASVEADYHFTMQLEFPDVLSAFASFGYAWAKRKVKDEELKKLAKLDPFAGGKRPSWGEVGAHRFRQANRYAREDVKTYIDNVSFAMGPPGTELTLVGAGILLRYVGTGIHWVIERLLTPRNERPIAFDGDGEGPGIYVVACSASPVLRGEGFVRAPSVVWMPVFVRSPEEMAQLRLDAIVKSDEEADARLEDLKKKLDQPVSWLNHDAMVAEAESIFKSKQGLDETLSLQVNQLTARRRQIENDDTMAAISERSAIDDQLKALNKTLEVRRKRGKLTGTVERIPAVFVGDKGQVLTLALEATQQGTTTDDSGRIKSETWYVSDLTTPNSDDAERTGATKIEAIEAALKKILEGTSSYGRGTVSFAVGREQRTIRITASEGSLMLEAIENLATVASIAAVVAAPFTGGASLSLLLPIGVIGAIPSAYRIASRVENGTFRWDLALVSDIVNVVGGVAGLGEVASSLKMLRLARGLMIMGVGANGLGVLVMGAGIAEQLESLSDLPPGLRAARTWEIIGNALLQAGIMIGAAAMEKGRSSELREGLTRAEGTEARGNRTEATENWLAKLSKETRDKLTNDPVSMEAFRSMDPEVRRMLTMCASICIPIPPPRPDQLKKIRDFMDRTKIPIDSQNLREFLHDARGRDEAKGGQAEMKAATDALEKCQTLQDAQRVFDAAIVRWAKDLGGIAAKVGNRWEFKRADGVVVREWEIDTFRTLANEKATTSYFQAHHGIQDAWATGRKIPGYRRDDCPAMLLRDSFAGSPHRRITDRQIAMRDSAPTRTYSEERTLMIDDLIRAEVPNKYADDLINRSDKYFGDLYKAWEADMKARKVPQATIDAALKTAFGEFQPK
jgi:hypothetical protein